MPEPVIVGFDGSERASDALVLGRALAQTLETRLVVVLAYTPEKWLWAPGTAKPMDAGERELAVARAESLLAGLDDVEVRTVASRSAAGALHAEAEREHAQILVVGSSHREGLGRLLLGTVTHDALDAAPCPVAVATAGLASKQPLSFARIGVGFDDAAPAHEALAFARLLARRAQARLHLIWAAHLVGRALPLAAISYADPNYFREVRAQVEARLEQVAAPIREELDVHTEIASGGTAGALIKKSERLDLLVLGSRSYGPLARVLLGSISRDVVNRAHCPVLVVPRRTKQPEDVEQSTETIAEETG
jgi:nucleotide-binding universal stress UspA family protein